MKLFSDNFPVLYYRIFHRLYGTQSGGIARLHRALVRSRLNHDHLCFREPIIISHNSSATNKLISIFFLAVDNSKTPDLLIIALRLRLCNYEYLSRDFFFSRARKKDAADRGSSLIDKSWHAQRRNHISSSK